MLCSIISRFTEPGEPLNEYIDEHLAKYGRIVGADESKVNRLRIGDISIRDLTFLLFEEQQRNPSEEKVQNSSTFINSVVSKLRGSFLVLDSVTGLTDAFFIDRRRYCLFRDAGLLENIIFGPVYTINRLRSSIPFIETCSEQGDIGIGTGFVVSTGETSDAERRFIVTNRHVLEGQSVEKIATFDNEFRTSCESILCDYADLAAIEVECDVPVQSLLIATDDALLTGIIALGYPKVARSIEPVLLAHSGEVNGIVKTVDGSELLAISCHVNPGNSGGPIIDSIGMCCGVVAQSQSLVFENPSVAGSQVSATYNMAIPGTIVNRFIAESCGSPMRVQPGVLC